MAKESEMQEVVAPESIIAYVEIEDLLEKRSIDRNKEMVSSKKVIR